MGISEKPSFFTKLLLLLMRRSGRIAPFSIPSDIEEARNILFIDSGELTDILFFTPLVNYFKNKFPDVKSTIVVDERFAPVVKGLMRVNLIVSYRRDQMKLYKADYVSLLKKVAEKRSDIAILLGDSFSLERYLIATKSKAPIRIGLYNPFSFPFLNCEVRISSNGYEGKKAERILSSIGLKKDEAWRKPALSGNDLKHAKQLIHFRKPEKGTLTVGLDPGKSKTRHYIIPDVIAYLANNLASRRKVKFLVLSAHLDEREKETFEKKLKGEIIDLEPSNLMEAVSFISQCDIFVSGNTDLFHYAAALGTPTLGLFTRYDEPRWVPDETDNVRIITGSRGEKLSLKEFFGKVDELLAIRG